MHQEKPLLEQENRPRRTTLGPAARGFGAALALLVAHGLGAPGVIAQPGAAPGSDAASGEIPVSLALQGPEGCGSESDLIARMRWRTNRVRFVAEGPSVHALRVELAGEESSTVATLYVTEPNGRRSTRTLRAKSCAQAIDAAALVLAVTLDPLASTAPTPESIADGGSSESEELDASPLPVPEATAKPPGDDETDPPDPPPPPAADSGPSSFVPSIAVVGQVLEEPAPGLLFGLGLSLGVAWERESPFSPALRMTLSRFFPRGFAYDAGTAVFDLWVASFDLCPLKLVLGHEAVTAHPCATFNYGQVTAEGTETVDGKRAATDWWVLGGTALLQWRPIEPLLVALSGTVGQPLVLDAFNFEPDPAFHHVSSPTWTVGLGAGVFFR